MKTLNSLMILAGGKGTRFKEYTKNIPKPMIEVLEKPLIIHIIDIYKEYGVKNIYILGGYKQDVIIDYFKNKYEQVMNSYNSFNYEDVVVKILDTGLDTMTGTRILIGLDEVKDNNFYLTYGDGLCDVNIAELTKFHLKTESTVTLTAVNTPERFGKVQIEDGRVTNFGEKTTINKEWINGGFFVVNQEVKKYLNLNNCIFEKEPMQKLSNDNKLHAFQHDGFWQCVDTIRELEILESKLLEDKSI